MIMRPRHSSAADLTAGQRLGASPPHFSERRRQNGVSLADISRRTKIPLPLLEDLERERFDRFPPGIFARAYVRAYAEEACLDMDVLLARVIRKLPGDEALSDVNEFVGESGAAGQPSTLLVTRPFLRARYVTMILATAALILVALGIGATQPGASLATRIHQLLSPPLTNGELSATALPAEDQAQPVGSGGTGPALTAADNATIASSNATPASSAVGFPASASGGLSRRSVGLRNGARRTTDRQPDSRIHRFFSGVGGVFKKLFAGDEDQRRNSHRR